MWTCLNTSRPRAVRGQTSFSIRASFAIFIASFVRVVVRLGGLAVEIAKRSQTGERLARSDYDMIEHLNLEQQPGAD